MTRAVHRWISGSLALSVVLLALISAGCSKGNSSSDGGGAVQKLAATSSTPLFRNLGKRGESKL